VPEAKFRNNQLIAFTISFLLLISCAYTILFPERISKTTVEKKIVLKQPLMISERVNKGRVHYVRFVFLDNPESFYELHSPELKFSNTHKILRDIAYFDTLLVESNSEKRIFYLEFKGLPLVDKEEAKKWGMQNGNFTLFLRFWAALCCLPILFFKTCPRFWYSGFEFDFRFDLLFFVLFIGGLTIYFLINGYDYLIPYRP
jgi:hypothetical protein